MKGGIGQLMKQAQQMQEDMKKAQEELSNITITGESGGGMVSVIMTCKHEIKALNIDNALLSASIFNEAIFINSSSVISEKIICLDNARSGQSICKSKPAFTIFSYSTFIRKDSASKYASLFG